MNKDNHGGKATSSRGYINIIILQALSESEKYGYEIGKYIESSCEGSSVKQPTLYSSLKRLEERGIITSYWGDETESNGGRRKYYKLTEAGQRINKRGIDDWSQSRELINEIISDTNRKKPADIFEYNENTTVKMPVYPDSNEPAPSDKNAGSTALNAVFETDVKGIEYKSVLSKLLYNVKSVKTDAEMVTEDSKDREKLFVQAQVSPAETTISKAAPITADINTADSADTTETAFEPRRTLTEEDRTPAAQPDNRGSSGTRLAVSKLYGKLDTTANAQGAKLSEDDFFEEREAYPAGERGTLDNPAARELSRQVDSGGRESAYSLLPSSNNYATASPLSKLRSDMQTQGIDIRPHTNLKKQAKQFLLVNKISHLSMLMLYLIMCIETLAIYFIWGETVNLPINYYAYAALILLIFPFAATVQYIVYPDKKTKRRYYVKNTIISGIMAYLVLAVAITAIAMLLGINVNIPTEVILKLYVPYIYASNFVLYAAIWSALYTSKRCFV